MEKDLGTSEGVKAKRFPSDTLGDESETFYGQQLKTVQAS